jgi:iron(III) transport system substrate-binding protein
LKRILILVALAAVLAVPFLLRPPRAGSAALDTVVVVTPHNEGIRHEFGLAFASWYQARTGRSVRVDWRVPGGTSEITRLLEGQYVASFRMLWEGTMGRPWTAAVQAGFQDDELPPGAPPDVRGAREAFLSSGAGCGMDVFFGGDTYNFDRQARAGRLVDAGVGRRHPGWFTDGAIPLSWGGEPFRDPQGRWVGSVASSYGILFNRDALRRLGLAEPRAWADLADPGYFGQVALCDPTKSSSVATAFENLIQQRMAGAPGVAEGWLDGLRTIQRIGANARYFTDSSQKPPIDVADGSCAAGMCIDFYGREQQESVERRGGAGRLGFVSPPGGTAFSVDPIALLRGAPHRAAAEAFIDFVLSPEGQRLWGLRPGTPGGPHDFALRRLPVRRDFYSDRSLRPLRTDPDDDPFAPGARFIYRPEWTAPLFREMALIIRVMCQDTHGELAAAWRAAAAAPPPVRARALDAMQDLRFVDYARAGSVVRDALGPSDPLGEPRVARELGDGFRARYARALRIASGQDAGGSAATAAANAALSGAR